MARVLLPSLHCSRAASGDILILSPEVLAVGISQRTEEDSIDKFAHTVLSISKTFKKILAFNIPKSRSFMHLSTDWAWDR